MDTLSDDCVLEALGSLPGWAGSSRAINAQFAFPSYEAGVAFAVQVAMIAQGLNHHPEISIGWKRVGIAFTTHDAGGVTARDLAAARAVSAVAPAAGVEATRG